ncbi:MAG: hypothetical protein IJM98_08640 [Oscillospiraceae bacterium]|nr:hypothetical protein [Oscillospiraceae bacterium]
MNFTNLMEMPVRGHSEIDFVDIHVDGDNGLYIDPERIALSNHPFAKIATETLEDFFYSLYSAAAEENSVELYRLLSFGREPNETHLGMSEFRSRGKGTTPEIMLPIIHDMIDAGMFSPELFTQISDLPLWTPNFDCDRMSDLTTNIIRSVLVEYTYSQFEYWNLPLPENDFFYAPTWDICRHEWVTKEFPRFLSGGYTVLLVPKDFVGRRMLSSSDELLKKYVLKYRQQEHLDQRSEQCHIRVMQDGTERLYPPTKQELYDSEVRGNSAKDYLRWAGNRYRGIVKELHADHHFLSHTGDAYMSDDELDHFLYSYS